MPPRPLQNLNTQRPYSSTYEYQALTPRTPHSSASRQEAYEDVDLDAGPSQHYDDHGPDSEQQSQPLLSRNTYPPTTWRRDGKRLEINRAIIAARAPLVFGVLLAVGLLFAFIQSIRRPESLLHYVGVKNTSAISDADLEPPETIIHTPVHLLSYENYTEFPLKPIEYLRECNKWFNAMNHHIGGYWYIPPEGPMDVEHHDTIYHDHLPEHGLEKTCSSSITYMLDGYVGLTADLALAAQVAGLAREQNRTFFINDQFWNRGRWTDHFQDVTELQPGPEPGCLPPRPEELVACPRVSRHWVVNSRTAKFHFGHKFEDEFEDAYHMSLRRKKPIFERSAESFAWTIRPSVENAQLIRKARLELKGAVESRLFGRDAQSPESDDDDLSYLAVHVRRGDRVAQAWPNRGKYVPYETYAKAIQETQKRLLGYTPSEEAPGLGIWIASDTPDAVPNLHELIGDHIPIYSLEQSDFAVLRALGSTREYNQSSFNELTSDERVALTRGAVVDFAVVSGLWAWHDDITPAATICTGSSNFCRLTPMGYGWDRAFGFGFGPEPQNELNQEHARWVEIEFKGVVEPVWQSVEMF